MSALDNIRQLVELFDQHRKIESTDRQIDRLVYELPHSAMLRG